MVLQTNENDLIILTASGTKGMIVGL